jgi:hypothetical protein
MIVEDEREREREKELNEKGGSSSRRRLEVL